MNYDYTAASTMTVSGGGGGGGVSGGGGLLDQRPADPHRPAGGAPVPSAATETAPPSPYEREMVELTERLVEVQVENDAWKSKTAALALAGGWR